MNILYCDNSFENKPSVDTDYEDEYIAAKQYTGNTSKCFIYPIPFLNMKIIALFSFLLCSGICLFGCGKTCVEASYSFNMTEQFYPELDSIKVGDTVWSISSHSTTFTDITTGKNVNYSGSDLGLNIQLLNLSDSAIASGYPGTFHSFTTIVMNGSNIGNDNLPDQNKGVNYEEKNDSFLLKVVFIPKEKGVYAISLSDASAVRHHHGCELAVADVANANADNHLYMYQNSRPGYEISI